MKTAALNALRNNSNDAQTRAEIARCFKDAVVETLAIKCRRSLEQTGITRLIVAGGVGANR